MFLPSKTSAMMHMEEDHEEDEEVIIEFGDYNNKYYVQSPSSMSHANSTTDSELCRNHAHLLQQPPSYQYHHHSPNNLPLQKQQQREEDESYSYPTKPLLSSNLSRCSSSRASTTSFVHHNDNNKMMTLLPSSNSAPAHHHSKIMVHSGSKNNNNVVVPVAKISAQKGKVDDGDYEDHEECYSYEEGNASCWQYFSFNTYPSSAWIALQLLWRFLLSLIIALLVFYLATKPPPPHLSLKVTRVNQFELTEGLDLTGVATNFLSCNISMALIVDNRSKVFGLHILSPLIDIYFGRVPFVLSPGPEMYVRSREWREMEIFGGTTKKAMYGGGRNMEDMLNSEQGLPLLITLTFTSYFRMVPNFIHSHYHHRAHCLLLLHHMYDQKHHTQAYNSTCLFTS